MGIAVDFIPQSYKSVSEFLTRWQLAASRHREWRLTDRIVGHINGLPESFGHLTATDGILCYIEQRGRLYCGHVGWFIPQDADVDMNEVRAGAASVSKRSTKRACKLTAEELDAILV